VILILSLLVAFKVLATGLSIKRTLMMMYCLRLGGFIPQYLKFLLQLVCT
jgi:hypothetical protein